MPNLGLKGSFDFNGPTIDAQISRTSPGNYALGYVNGNIFYVLYVGRDDVDVNKRLHQHLYDSPNYKSFYWDYATSPKSAFEKECSNYHDFGGPEGKLYNKIHPARPDGANWKCPRCGFFN